MGSRMTFHLGASVTACVLCLPLGCVGSPVIADETLPPAADDIERREVWIAMPDGVRLAADLYLPKEIQPAERLPVLLEYIPYRKTESRSSTYSLASYFVRRGYVVARVDIRGSGSSEGRVIEYEYCDQEQTDAEAVIDWLSKQPFSNGNVGMFGISWGGFNSIHLAMRNPPALKAIIAIMATDDLFEDDVRYIDGQMHVDAYELGVDIANALPGAPEFVIDEKYFRERFDTPPWLPIYKRQQRDGPFWDRASLNAHYDSIKIPTFVIGGWYDAYRDSVPRMLEHLEAPVKAIVGPWAHAYPHQSYPKPAIEWRHEAVRWFDHWLKGHDTGIMEEPRFAVFVRDWHPPDPNLEVIPGAMALRRGLAARAHPIPDLASAAGSFAHGFHARKRHARAPLHSDGRDGGRGDRPLVGRGGSGPEAGGRLQPRLRHRAPRGGPRDPGHAQGVAHASATAPLAHWFVRLSDVAPDGTVTLVAGAGLNGAHRESAEKPKPLEPGRVYDLEIDMHFTSWVFPKGHSIRLAVNNAQWPMAWPTPYPMTTSLHLGGENPTRVVLPVVPHADRPRPSFLAPAEDPKRCRGTAASSRSWPHPRDMPRSRPWNGIRVARRRRWC